MTNRGAPSGVKPPPPLIPPGVIWEYGGAVLPDPAIYGAWVWADGSLVSRGQYPDLFNAVGFNHSPTPGTDPGNNQFYLPNKKGAVGVGMDSGQTEFNTLGKVAGSKTSTAVHTHGFTSSSQSAATSTTPSASNTGGPSPNSTNTLSGSATGNQGGDHLHNVTAGLGGGNIGLTAGANQYNLLEQTKATGYQSPQNHAHAYDHGHDLQSHTHGPGSHTHDLSHTHSGTSGGGSVDVASGNLQPYVVLNYIVKA